MIFLILTFLINLKFDDEDFKPFIKKGKKKKKKKNKKKKKLNQPTPREV